MTTPRRPQITLILILSTQLSARCGRSAASRLIITYSTIAPISCHTHRFGPTLLRSECPRFTERRDWGQWANGDTNATPDAAEEIISTYSSPAAASWTCQTECNIP